MQFRIMDEYNKSTTSKELSVFLKKKKKKKGDLYQNL